MRHLKIDFSILLCLALLTACTPGTPATLPAPTQVDESAVPATRQPLSPTNLPDTSSTDFPAATSIALTAVGDTVYMIVGHGHSLYVLRSTDGGQTFSEPVSATGDHTAHVLRVERPAIAANDRGEVSVSWLELDLSGEDNKVWYASSKNSGGTFGEPHLVSTEPSGETAMVEVILDAEGNPLLSWLGGNDLRFSRSSDHGQTFSTARSIGEGACECCQPDMLVTGDELMIGYRGLGEDQTGKFRDAALIRSQDEGESFGPVSFATDSRWYIDACPISGPSIAMNENNIYITWMDGRAVAPDNLLSSDVWFAVSTDEGETFSSNVKLSDGSSTHSFLPVMAVGPNGRIHLAWQAISADAIYYVTSDDGGKTFSSPQVIADDSSPERGRPTSPTIAIDAQGRVYLAWLDDSGVQLSVWEDSK